MYDITTFSNDKTTFTDYTNKIVLKKTSEKSQSDSISDMLDLADIKGWKLDKLTIRGSDKFVHEVHRQIKIRLQPKSLQLEQSIKGGIKM